MQNKLEEDLKKCLTLINADWSMQRNTLDRETNFIYRCNSLEECLEKIDMYNVNKEYALHRWYNYMTSIRCEYIFCEYGAEHEKDIFNHDVDIYIDGIPFDVKLTVYPAKLNEHPYNLNTRTGKNEMIQWYYKNQSQQSRKQMLNRIYVVCDADTSYDCLCLKSDFDILRNKIASFMDYCSSNGINKVTVIDEKTEYTLYSDIIYITKEKE